MSAGVMRPTEVAGNQAPERGPCPQCHKRFPSWREKLYCSMPCYLASDLFRENRDRALRLAAARNTEAGTRNGYEPTFAACTHCGTQNRIKPSRARNRLGVFCNRTCYRAYLAVRFDQFIANPESIALPQNYDEFLDRDELSCPVFGCDWTGKALAYHARLCHGIPKRQFKILLGFNLKTGLVSRDVSAAMSASHDKRPDIDRCRDLLRDAGRRDRGGDSKDGRAYRSNEGREHAAKSLALNGARSGYRLDDATKEKISRKAMERLAQRPPTELLCASCGGRFVTTATGRLPSDCGPCVRKEALRRNREDPWKEAVCSFCHGTFMGTRNHIRLARKGGPALRCGRCKEAM